MLTDRHRVRKSQRIARCRLPCEAIIALPTFCPKQNVLAVIGKLGSVPGVYPENPEWCVRPAFVRPGARWRLTTFSARYSFVHRDGDSILWSQSRRSKNRCRRVRAQRSEPGFSLATLQRVSADLTSLDPHSWPGEFAVGTCPLLLVRFPSAMGAPMGVPARSILTNRRLEGTGCGGLSEVCLSRHPLSVADPVLTMQRFFDQRMSG